MAALTHQQWYDQVLEAVQLLSTNDSSGNRRDVVSFTVDGMTTSYAASQLPQLKELMNEIANKLCNRNRRKRTSPDFSYTP